MNEKKLQELISNNKELAKLHTNVECLYKKFNKASFIPIYQGFDENVLQSKASEGVCRALSREWMQAHRTNELEGFIKKLAQGIPEDIIEQQAKMGADAKALEKEAILIYKKIFFQDDGDEPETPKGRKSDGEPDDHKADYKDYDSDNDVKDEVQQDNLPGSAAPSFDSAAYAHDKKKLQEKVDLSKKSAALFPGKEEKENIRGEMGDLVTALSHTIGELKQAKYCSLHLNKESGGHVICFHIDPRGKCSMFDATTGSFEFENSKDLLGFLKIYQEKMLAERKWEQFKITSFEEPPKAKMSTAQVFSQLNPKNARAVATNAATNSAAIADANPTPVTVINTANVMNTSPSANNTTTANKDVSEPVKEESSRKCCTIL